MGDAEERKRAKEAYMKALEAQRQKPADVVAAAAHGAPQGNGQMGSMSAAQKREQQLEERRKKFFDKSDGGNALPANRNNYAAPDTATVSTDVRVVKDNLKAVDAVIRPSDWKSKGYPSEYAYMKAAGQLSISSKPTVDAPPVNSHMPSNPFEISTQENPPLFQQARYATDQHNQYNLSADNGGRVNKESSALDPQFGSHFLTYNSKNPMNGGGGLNIGGIDDKEQKRLKQMEYARALDQQQAQPLPRDTRNVPNGNASQIASHKDDRGAGGGLNIGSAVDDKEAKRQKQAEYARALDQQSHIQQPESQHRTRHGQGSNSSNPSSELVGGGGLNFGAIDDKELKRQKQNEYARALDQQAHAGPHVAKGGEFMPYNPQNPANGGGGGGLNIGGTVDDKEAKRQKQAEYARALDQQSFAQPTDVHQHQSKALAQHNANVSANRGDGGGGLNFGSVDDKEAKRQKQTEYARALDQQSHAQPVVSHHASQAVAHHSTIDPTNGGGGLNIGTVDDKDAKRQKQAEYARALSQQQQSNAWGGAGNGRGGSAAVDGHGYGLGLAGLGGPGPQEAAYAKKQQQQEYTAQLNQAQYQQPAKLNKFGEYDQHGAREHQPSHSDAGGLSGLGGPQGKEALNVKRQQQQEYTSQLNAQAQYQQPVKLNKLGEYEQPGRLQAQQQVPSGARNADISNIGADDGKIDKRAKQAEYNMALQHQQYLQSMQQPLQSRKHAEQRAGASTAATGFKANGGLEEGWVIGPMGLPVRKTLEVGNRGVQRAYANHIAETHSPSKVHMGGSDDAHGRGFDVDSFQQAAYMLNSPPRYGGPVGPGQMNGAGGSYSNGQNGAIDGDIGGNPDDRARKVKQQQAEQARVLEMQIRANQDRKNAEKKRIQEEDEKEMQRMEMQRIAIQKELEREALEKKMKIDEENRKELERQMIAKRAEKEAELAREQARLEKEELKVRAEAEVIRRRQELEMQQEAAAAQMQHHQRQQAVEMEKKQNQLQAEALHRKHTPVVHQVPMEYFESTSEHQEQDRRDGATKPGSRGGSRDNSHLFDRPDSFQGPSHGDHPSRGGARDRSHLFERADDQSSAPSALRTDYEHSPRSRHSPTPMSPNKRHVDRLLAERVHSERLDSRPDSASQQERHRMLRQQHHEAEEEAKGRAAPMLNLNNLKRNISEGAVVSGRRSARSTSRNGLRAGTAPKASPHDPYHPERERQQEEADAEVEDSFSPLPMHRPPSRSVAQNANRKSGHKLEENQYIPTSQMHAQQAYGGRLDKTLEFESKFLLPDGTFMHSNSQPSTPARTARWSRLGAQDVGHHSDNRCNSRGSSSAMADMLSPGKSLQDSPQRSISSPASGPTKSLIDEFKDTLYLLQEPRAALAQSMAQQRPSTSGSTNSDFDLEKFNRRNARKWQVLQNINGNKDSPEEDLLFRAIGDVNSRPSTSGSVGGYRPKLFDPFPEEKGGYSYGGRAEPASAFNPVRGGGIAVGSSDDLTASHNKGTRPNSAELARRLSRLNNQDVHQDFEPPRGYASRPKSGKRDNNTVGGDSFSMGQRAEMSLQAPSGGNSYGSRNRYANVAASVQDPDFDNYSDYGL